MAADPDFWTAILKPAYSTYQCEEDAYIEISKVTIDNEIALDYLFDNAICDNKEVSKNLQMLYNEAINGSDKEVHRRMLSRMSHFKRVYGYVIHLSMCYNMQSKAALFRKFTFCEFF